MKKNNLYYWTCDNSENSGEGKLALLFLKDLKRKFVIIKIKIPTFNNVLLKKILDYKYISPFVGVFFCWKYYLKNKKSCYINYLPFWNFFIFLLLPPNSKIGPITGGAKFNHKSSFVRKILFPYFYKISEFIVNYRNFDLIFSTDLLKQYLNKKTIKKSSFNFVVKNFKYKNKKIKDKKIDFLIYYRNHKNKIRFFPFRLIKKLIAEGFKINIVGDKLKVPSIKNHGFISNKALDKLQQKSKFTVFSEENLYSFFTLECISNNVLILINKNYRYKIKFFKKNFIKIDFDKSKELHKLNNLYKK